MSSTPEQERLLDALSENSLVKAALMIREDGEVLAHRGQAKALAEDHDGHIASDPDEEPTENVYMIQLTEDILAVVFEDAIDFEKLRRTVDTLIKHSGLKAITRDS